MIEAFVFIAALLSDQLLKIWSVNVLAAMPGGYLPILGDFFYLFYAENWADDVSFIRGRSAFMNIIRILQVVLIIYLLIKQRKHLAKITRVGLVLFLAGLIGNQLNYIVSDFVPDMFVLSFIPGYVFNLADVFVVIAMLILFVRLAFYEGQTFIDWLLKSDKHKKKSSVPDNLGSKDSELDAKGLDANDFEDASYGDNGSDGGGGFDD